MSASPCVMTIEVEAASAAAGPSRRFRPFAQLSSTYDGVDGMGVGLALVKRMMEHMGGDIDVESTLRPGASLRIMLPKTAPA